MTRSLRNIRKFGISTYLSKKLYAAAPQFYMRRFGGSDTGFTKTAYGVEMAENWGDATFRMCVFGQHGAVLSDLLTGIQTPFFFMDVGSNQGLYALIAASNPHCTGVLAFEPVAETFDILTRNIRNSEFHEKITPVQAAISSEAGTAEIRYNDDHSGGATLATANTKGARRETITVIAADGIAPYLPPDVALIVKVDVEGYEAIVLPELLKLCAADRISQIFFEVDLRWLDYDALERQLRLAGFSRFDRSGGSRHFDVLAQRG